MAVYLADVIKLSAEITNIMRSFRIVVPRSPISESRYAPLNEPSWFNTIAVLHAPAPLLNTNSSGNTSGSFASFSITDCVSQLPLLAVPALEALVPAGTSSLFCREQCPLLFRSLLPGAVPSSSSAVLPGPVPSLLPLFCRGAALSSLSIPPWYPPG